jgi:O-antigen biosynthesis protein
LIVSDEIEDINELCVGILFYEKPEQTIKCIKSLQNKEIKIYLMNNGSSKKATQIVEKHTTNLTNIDWIDSKKNVGVGVGRNKIINKSHEKWIFFIDNDICIKTVDYIKLIYKAIIKNPSIEVFIPKLYNYHQSRYHKTRSLIIEGKKIEYTNEVEPTLNNFPGGASIVSRELFKRLGTYDEKMFVGFEDIEISIRGLLKHEPIKALRLPELELLHNHKVLSRKEDLYSAQIRYDYSLIESSYNRMLEKHDIEFEKTWPNWISHQQNTIMRKQSLLSKIMKKIYYLTRSKTI